MADLPTVRAVVIHPRAFVILSALIEAEAMVADGWERELAIAAMRNWHLWDDGQGHPGFRT